MSGTIFSQNLAALLAAALLGTAAVPVNAANANTKSLSKPSAKSLAPKPVITAPFGDTLSGALPKIVKAADGPFVITADIVVPQGKTVILEPGTVFLFRNFTGLKVQGTLLAQGTADKPIIFTSINDKQFHPSSALDAAPYDWNGIYIYEDGIGSYFSYCTIYYSVFGINSLTKYVRLGPTIFKNNGRSNLTIEGTEHQVGDKPYEYSMTVKDTVPGGVPLTVLRDPNATRRNAFRYSGFSVTAAGAALAILFTPRFNQSLAQFNAASATDPQNLANGTGSDWQAKHSKVVTDRIWMVSGYTLVLLGAIGVSWSFTF